MDWEESQTAETVQLKLGNSREIRMETKSAKVNGTACVIAFTAGAPSLGQHIISPLSASG